MKKPVKRGRPPLAVKRKAGRPKKVETPLVSAENTWTPERMADFLDRGYRRTALEYAAKSVPAVGDLFVDHAEKIYQFLKGGETKVPVQPAAEAELLSVLRGDGAYASDADTSKRDFYNARDETVSIQNEIAAGEVVAPAEGGSSDGE